MKKQYTGFTSDSVFERVLETMFHSFLGTVLIVATAIVFIAIIGGLSYFVNTVVNNSSSIVLSIA